MDKLPDMSHGLEFEDYEMVRPLLFLAHLQQEEGTRTRKALRKAIKKQAQARAKDESPGAFLAYQKAIDEDIGDILLAAAERVDILLRDPQHFIKKKTKGSIMPTGLHAERRRKGRNVKFSQMSLSLNQGTFQPLHWHNPVKESMTNPTLPLQASRPTGHVEKQHHEHLTP